MWNKALSDFWCNVKFSLSFTSEFKEIWRENLVIYQKSLKAFLQAPLQLVGHQFKQSQQTRYMYQTWELNQEHVDKRQVTMMGKYSVLTFHEDFCLGSLAFGFIHCNITIQKNTALPFFSQPSIHCVMNVILYRHFPSQSLLSTHADLPNRQSPSQHLWMPLGTKI